MIRMFGSAVVSRAATIAIGLVVITLMALSLYELLREFIAPFHDQAESKEIMVNVTVVMIGWGVALEERGSVRDVFGVRGGDDDGWQDRIDHACHGVGLMLLLFGLFAEISEQLLTLPKTVVSTEPIRDVLLVVAMFFVASGLFLLVRHVIQLALMRKHQTGKT